MLVERQPAQKVGGTSARLSAVSTEAQKAILYFIHIHQVYYETHFFANLKKKKEILACYICLFLNQASKEMVAKPLEAFKYLSDFHQMCSVQEKEKKNRSIFLFLLCFNLI